VGSIRFDSPAGAVPWATPAGRTWRSKKADEEPRRRRMMRESEAMHAEERDSTFGGGVN